ncbi:MAG: hypothetical protein J6S69_00510 [Proteobacteria bacterium]|nr:hypothetical protein [Pseudomonadota bacterium]
MMDSRKSRDDMEMDDDSLDNEAIDAELIEEWCPNCKDMRPHAKVKGNKIACAECNHEHIREVDTLVTVQSVLTAEDRASEQSLHDAWERLTQADNTEIKTYSIKAKFEDGDIVRHNKFGVGVVVEMIDTTKAEILFEEGIKRLVCGK